MRFKVTRMSVVNAGQCNAYFDFQDDELGLYFNNWKLMERRGGGRFVCAPSSGKRDESGKWEPNFIGAIVDQNTGSRHEKGTLWLAQVLRVAEDAYNSEGPVPEGDEEAPW